MNSPLILVLIALLVATSVIHAEPLTIDAAVSARGGGQPFHLGTTTRPDGAQLTADHVSLLSDGKPFIATMGEFHFTRCPESEWRGELLKMKAGGIDIVASYVFWIHHEEVEGQFDWTGQRNLRKFVSLCGELGLKSFIRCGPWAHGECRNGGFPDWMLHKGFKLRSNDPAYLAEVTTLYNEIAKQLQGQLWKDGGPVIGIQVENEFGGSPDYMIHLKNIARDAGVDVPLYTRTAWPVSRNPYPPNELLPMYGAYAAGFWDRNTSATAGRYSTAFLFAHQRIDTQIGTDQLGNRPSTEPAGADEYPYFACEMGGGMETSYHRRIHIDPPDIVVPTIIKIGSGCNLPGYYMYHGGMNPEGKLSTLQESQATAYPNDLPVKNYDFQAPLGEYGQERAHYHLLRRMHLFLHDFGAQLAPMPAVLPRLLPAKTSDSSTLRWSVRTDGDAGFLFVSNYQRLQSMPARDAVQFDLHLTSGSLQIPPQPINIPANCAFFWPFNVDLGGARLLYATAQPVCQLKQHLITYTIFAQTPGVLTEFAFDPSVVAVDTHGEIVPGKHGNIYVRQPTPGTEAVARLRTRDDRESVIILLDQATSLQCWKGVLNGQETIFLTGAGLTVDGDSVALTSSDPSAFTVAMLPAPRVLSVNGKAIAGTDDGLFRRFTIPVVSPAPITATTEVVQAAGPPREIRMGHGKVAEAPSDADFEKAAVWRIKLPPGTSPDRDALLRISYAGDVARLYLDGKLIDDNFYNGNTFDLGLRRFAPDVYNKELLLKVLPLRKDAPIYLPPEAWPKANEAASFCELNGIDLIENKTVEMSAGDAKRP